MANVKSRTGQIISPVQIISFISKWASWISYAALTAMMAFVFYDVIARYFDHPTSGSNDIVQLLTLIAVAFTFSYTQLVKRNPSTSFLVMYLPRKTQEILQAVTCLLGLIPFALLIWTSATLAGHFLETHEGTLTLGVPLYPLVYCIALGSVLMCLVLIVDLVESLRKVVKR